MKKIQLENLQESVYVFLAVVISVLLFGILLYFIVCNNAKQYEYISCVVWINCFFILLDFILLKLIKKMFNFGFNYFFVSIYQIK